MNAPHKTTIASVLAAALLGLVACTAEPTRTATPPEPLDEVKVGEFLFKDLRLSSSGQMACATCHAEAFGHADVPGVHLPMGGPQRERAGKRSSPTARYLNTNPAFSIDAQGNAWGGFTWDGRADTRAAQAADPFFDHAEMALDGSPEQPQALLRLVRSADYYPQIRQWYAQDDLSNDRLLFQRVIQALEVYQRDDQDYNRFDSRYDLALAGQAPLSAQEQRGQAIFNNPLQGNCMGCHTSQAQDKRPVFTNFGFYALGVPRNPASGAVIANPDFHDLGLCTSGRQQPAGTDAARYCGQFKTPTLRNVERSAPYFHNGAVATLEEAVRFHFTRETEAARWFGSAKARYNDLPAKYHGNVVQGKPFDGSWVPSDSQMQDLLAFLKTLNDADQTEPLLADAR
jgi:cytochrome c peroxidase